MASCRIGVPQALQERTERISWCEALGLGEFERVVKLFERFDAPLSFRRNVLSICGSRDKHLQCIEKGNRADWPHLQWISELQHHGHLAPEIAFEAVSIHVQTTLKAPTPRTASQAHVAVSYTHLTLPTTPYV